jgi:hypothetical protein
LILLIECFQCKTKVVEKQFHGVACEARTTLLLSGVTFQRFSYTIYAALQILIRPRCPTFFK